MPKHRSRHARRRAMRLCESLEVSTMLSTLGMSNADSVLLDGQSERLLALEPQGPATATRAFPEAEGYGAQAIGGRGGELKFVTNLNDSGPGSLRDAVEASGPRIVVFRVAGVITLNQTLNVSNPYLTIAGQTAPLPGITLRLDPSSFAPDKPKSTEVVLTISTHDVVVRYLKLRRGDTKQSGDNINILAPAHDVVIDRVSLSWATDESVTIWTFEQKAANEAQGVYNVSFQNSIIGESLNQDPRHWLNPNVAHTQAQIDDPSYTDYVGDIGANVHALGFIVGGQRDYSAWQKVRDIDIHHNLFANNTHRNPRVAAHGIRIINNVIFNWFTRAGSSEKSTIVDYIGNVYQHGPLSRSVDGGPSVPARPRFLWHDLTNSDLVRVDPGDPSIYISQNIAPAIPEMADPGNDNWSMLMESWTGDVRGTTPQLDLGLRRNERLPDPLYPVTITTPTIDNMLGLVANAGATQFLDANGQFQSSIDYVDARTFSALETGDTRYSTKSRIYKTTDQAGGYERFANQLFAPYPDADLDGMADGWELLQGADLQSHGDDDNDGYTNLEEFLNGTDPLRAEANLVLVGVDAPGNLVLDDTGGFANSLSIELDEATNEFIISAPINVLSADGILRTSELRISRGLVTGGLIVNLGAGDDELNFSRINLNSTVVGGAGDDSIRAGNGINQIAGGSGDDFVVGGMRLDIVRGGDGRDTMFGGADGDQLFGDAGEDIVVGNGGNDEIQGGPGSDVLSGGGGFDFLRENLSPLQQSHFLSANKFSSRGATTAESDQLAGFEIAILIGSRKSETIDASRFGHAVQIIGGAGDDTIIGTSFADTLGGSSGNDVIDGLADNDLINGGTGDDLLDGSFGNDVLIGGDGRDGLAGFAGDDLLMGGNDADTLHGGLGNDSAYGGRGDDANSGNAGSDFLLGDFGNDTLVGGDDGDTLFGSAGDDLALGNAGSDVIRGQGGTDILVGADPRDSQVQDVIVGDVAEIRQAFSFDAWWIEQAPSALPRLTSLSNQQLSYTVPDSGMHVLGRGDVQAVVVDNRAIQNGTLPNHAAGYNGLASLTHASQPNNLFVPTFAGLNFEFMFDGTSVDRKVMFEPRRSAMQLRVIDSNTVELYQPVTENWQLESVARYEMLDDGTIEMTVEFIPHADTFRNDYIGLFWASYIQQPDATGIRIPTGNLNQTADPQWFAQDNFKGAFRSLDDNRKFEHAADFFELAFNVSDTRFAQPWFYGLSQGMAWALMFLPQDNIRFSQAPNGGGTGNPAWDFQFLVPDFEVGKRYQMVMRAQYLRYSSPEQITQATAANRMALGMDA